MLADFSVELGKDDPALEIPWYSKTSPLEYKDLKRYPELLREIGECSLYPELGDFLRRINANGMPIETAKCDAWCTTELAPEEEIFGATWKFVSYVDLLFSSDSARACLDDHTTFAKDICKLLDRAPEMASAAEFIVRHCHFHYHNDPDVDGSFTGFCITAYVTGYGDSQNEAQLRWAIALRMLQNVLVQITASN